MSAMRVSPCCNLSGILAALGIQDTTATSAAGSTLGSLPPHLRAPRAPKTVIRVYEVDEGQCDSGVHMGTIAQLAVTGRKTWSRVPAAYLSGLFSVGRSNYVEL